jgi:hypothetical protein
MFENHIATILHTFGFAAHFSLVYLGTQVIKTAFQSELVVAAQSEESLFFKGGLTLGTLTWVLCHLILRFKAQYLL